MHALTGSHVFVAEKLFATPDTTVGALWPESRPRILVSDTDAGRKAGRSQARRSWLTPVSTITSTTRRPGVNLDDDETQQAKLCSLTPSPRAGYCRPAPTLGFAGGSAMKCPGASSRDGASAPG